MAYNRRKHFVDPKHLLAETKYDDKGTRTCDICLLDLAGLAGYCCDDCDIHIHKPCADHFEQWIDSLPDRHRLKLIRTPGGRDRGTHVCDLCMEDCPAGSFLYRCAACDFDMHPLCSQLPETVDSPVHPGHRLHMITSPAVSCSACRQRLTLWHYVCSCSVNFKLHIACALGDDADEGHGGAAADQRGFVGGRPTGEPHGGGVGQRGLGNSFAEYAYTLKVDEKSDVYSFGVVLLELIAGRKPVGEFGDGVDIVQWVRTVTGGSSKEGVTKIADPRLSTVPLQELTHVFYVAMLCVAEQSVERPTMREVVQILTDMPGSRSTSTSGDVPVAVVVASDGSPAPEEKQQQQEGGPQESPPQQDLLSI